MKTASGAFALVILAVAWKPAVAVTPTASFSVTATVVAGCRVSTNATAIKIDAVQLTNSAPGVSVLCSNTAPYNIDVGRDDASRDDVGRTALTSTLISNSPTSFATARTSEGSSTAPDAHRDVIAVTITY